jgi:undecaprenyl diphosphate synthase
MNLSDLDPGKIPRHIAIILDGNGRWAKQRGLIRQQGHKAGADNVETVADMMIAAGIPYMTVYAFSTENWKRSQEEVSYLMGLMRWYLKNYIKTALRKGIRLRFLGDASRLDQELQKLIIHAEEVTKDMPNLTLSFAINYGGRDEILRAVRKVSRDVADGKLDEKDIDETVFSSYLDTKGLPDPDLMIRTSGEERISNFLLWQLAYSELYFTDVYWPDFSEEDLEKAIQSYAARDRRFGGRKK